MSTTTTTNPPKPSGENWSRVAKSYATVIDETDALNPSGAAARQTLDVVDTTLPFDQASYIIDMGTGSGPMISSVLNSPEHAPQIPSSARIVAADVAQGLLDMLAQRKAENETADPWKRLEIRNWDARDLKNEIPDNAVSHLISCYAYMAFRDEAKALGEAYRILKPGGLFTETSMGYTEWGHLPTFFTKVRPDKIAPGPGPHWRSIEGVKSTLQVHGFKDVQVREFEIGIPMQSHEAAVELNFTIFPFVEAFVADMSDAEIEKARQLMLEWVREVHPEQPLVLRGTALVGWGRK